MKKTNSAKTTNKTIFNRFKSFKVENHGDVKFTKKLAHEVSHEKKIEFDKDTRKKIEKTQIKKRLIRIQNNWAKELDRETLIKKIREGRFISRCKFKMILVSNLNLAGQHQSKDTWSALPGIESKDISLVKQIKDSGVLLLMFKESICQKAINIIKKNFDEAIFCDDVTLFAAFLSLRKDVVLGELIRLSKTFKNFIPLVNACRFIMKELNKESPDYGSFVYLESMMGEPARKMKDFDND